MSLLNVKLPDTVLASLFKNTVVQSAGDEVTPVMAKPVEQPEAAPEPAQPPVAKAVPVSKETPVSNGAYKFLGNNQRRVVVIVHFPGDVFLPDHHLQFLVKMLGACKLTMADVAIVNAATTPLLADKLKEQLLPAYMLLFGVEPTDIQLPLSFPPFKEQQYANCKYLLTPGLATLNQDNEEGKQLKRKLWDCLKAMFGV